MGNLLGLIQGDVRYADSLKACMNCGICTAICPAAEFYAYDPRRICDLVQRGNEEELEKLLRGDAIWYCGQCLSCKTRCPRGNVPGGLITILRKVSQELGYHRMSEYGRMQAQVAASVGRNITQIGYCVHPDRVPPALHPEQGPVWQWYVQYIKEVSPRFGANYRGSGAGALREIGEETLAELRAIFALTGGEALCDALTAEEEGA